MEVLKLVRKGLVVLMTLVAYEGWLLASQKTLDKCSALGHIIRVIHMTILYPTANRAVPKLYFKS